MSSHTRTYYENLSKQIEANIKPQLDIRENIGNSF